MSIPSGFNCTTCNTHHQYGAYVYGHFDEVLVHTCNVCGAKHDILQGVAVQTEPGVLPESATAVEPEVSPAATATPAAVVEEPPADQFRKGDVWKNSRGTPFLVKSVSRGGLAHMVNLKTDRTYSRPWADLGWKSGKPWVRESCGVTSQ